MSYKMGDAARHVGVNVETIRFYEREGILPPPSRTASGRRVFTTTDLKTLAFIRKARDLGFTLPDVRALLALRGPDNNCADVKEIALKHLNVVRAEKTRIVEVERLLSQAIEKCPGGSTKACTLLALLETTPEAED
ncbi:MAG: MerR family transcriptional regulator [Pseudolabrys sp.]|nr:MerR family transcriptional regulator [Pseudolabrys sp.]